LTSGQYAAPAQTQYGQLPPQFAPGGQQGSWTPSGGVPQQNPYAPQQGQWQQPQQGGWQQPQQTWGGQPQQTWGGQSQQGWQGGQPQQGWQGGPQPGQLGRASCRKRGSMSEGRCP